MSMLERVISLCSVPRRLAVLRVIRFAESSVGEGDGKSVNAFLHVAGERGDGGGVQAAAEEKRRRNIRDEVTGRRPRGGSERWRLRRKSSYAVPASASWSW